jgi:hypothetical protein
MAPAPPPPLPQVRLVVNSATPQGLNRAEHYCGLDQLGNHVWRLARPRIIRRAIGHPKSRDMAFYYNLLLAKVPFRDEEAVIPADGNYFVQCVRLSVFKTSDELDQHLQAYAAYNLYTNALLDKVRGDVEGFVAQAAAAALHHPGRLPDGAPDPHSADVYLAGADAIEAMQMEEGSDADSDGELMEPPGVVAAPCPRAPRPPAPPAPRLGFPVPKPRRHAHPLRCTQALRSPAQQWTQPWPPLESARLWSWVLGPQAPCPQARPPRSQTPSPSCAQRCSPATCPPPSPSARASEPSYSATPARI